MRHTKTGKISIQATKTDGTTIKKIPGAKVRIPYPDTGKKAVLKVTNRQGDTVTTAEYHEDQGIAEFEINEPGTYEVQTTVRVNRVFPGKTDVSLEFLHGFGSSCSGNYGRYYWRSSTVPEA